MLYSRMRTTNPTFRITRAIAFRGKKVPPEAECSACADARFRVRYDKREHFLEPNAESNLHSLKLQYENHLKLTHSANSTG
ncbi:MAG TPA: hypothetical protein VKH81_14440 [Candidatus Angelobacter sp.]|nr:hypothetical protein [Candidatus Angelobacter sp.]